MLTASRLSTGSPAEAALSIDQRDGSLGADGEDQPFSGRQRSRSTTTIVATVVCTGSGDTFDVAPVLFCPACNANFVWSIRRQSSCNINWTFATPNSTSETCATLKCSSAPNTSRTEILSTCVQDCCGSLIVVQALHPPFLSLFMLGRCIDHSSLVMSFAKSICQEVPGARDRRASSSNDPFSRKRMTSVELISFPTISVLTRWILT
mmetsp:Transcript_16956/g.29975  ORF Transcript_16956/g.29975 Transcript_16956/m.29975 type:complete len:207 (-) Transcript_16956:509-1129(-)